MRAIRQCPQVFTPFGLEYLASCENNADKTSTVIGHGSCVFSCESQTNGKARRSMFEIS